MMWLLLRAPQGELMVASTIFSADGDPPTMLLTLAYLEDTGW